jgi:hypothetical protein
MITRRRLLIGGAVTVAVAGLGVLAFGRSAAEEHIVTVVRGRLSFLKLDEAGLRQFAHDQVGALLTKRPTWNRLKYHFLNAFTKSFSKYDISNDKRTRSQRSTDSFASTYLLSSDFFRNGADATQVVHYVMFYDPMIPCGNPFARLTPEPEARS